MLRKQHVDDVIVQATYMSGDRNGIASALKLNPRLGILILTAPGSTQSGNELKNFYVSVSSSDRIDVIDVPENPGQPGNALNSTYKVVTGLRQKKRPEWLRKAIEDSVQLQSATFGTKVIANAFASQGDGSLGAQKARALLQDFWNLEHAEKGLEKKVGEWLTQKGFRPTKRYVFLFAKQGERNDEKAHHFTSILTWNLLMDKLARDSFEVIPVAAGNRIGLRTSPDLAEFWRDPAWKEMISGVDDRRAQLGLWCYLAMHYPSVSIIGMRSGIIEVPALVGIRTLFLEEKFNQQAKRMEQWIGKVSGFERQIVEVPPGIAQGLYWKKESEKRYATIDMRSQRRERGKHLDGMVMKELRINPAGLQASADASASRAQLKSQLPVSGPDLQQLNDEQRRTLQKPVLDAIKGKSMNQFGLTDAEWGDILHWVRL